MFTNRQFRPPSIHFPFPPLDRVASAQRRH
jgi:hypothetical protein